MCLRRDQETIGEDCLNIVESRLKYSVGWSRTGGEHAFYGMPPPAGSLQHSESLRHRVFSTILIRLYFPLVSVFGGWTSLSVEKLDMGEEEEKGGEQEVGHKFLASF